MVVVLIGATLAKEMMLGLLSTNKNLSVVSNLAFIHLPN
jgi:hypothetical protein